MSFLNDVVNIFLKYYPFLLSGIKNTLILSLVGTVAGLAVGLLTGMVRTAPLSKNPVTRTLHKILNGIIAVYVEIFRGTPMMVQAMVIYWGYAFATEGKTLPLIPSALSCRMPCSQNRRELPFRTLPVCRENGRRRSLPERDRLRRCAQRLHVRAFPQALRRE